MECRYQWHLRQFSLNVQQERLITQEHCSISSLKSSRTTSLASSETQGQSVGWREGPRRKFLSSGKSPWVPTLTGPFPKIQTDAGSKNLCIIVPNQRTASLEFFSCVRTRLLMSHDTCLVRSPLFTKVVRAYS